MNAPLMSPVVNEGDPLDQEALAELLASPVQAGDMEALDLLYRCWNRNTRLSQDDRLLMVAQNLTISFGLPNRLPMASSRAWRMLAPHTYAIDFASQLREIVLSIKLWQDSRTEFLILEFGEMDLIEYMFESLDIGAHADLLSTVMTFKVLSMRRAGLLRRIPARVERQFAPLVESGRADLAVAELAKVKEFLDRFAGPEGFAPIIDAARNASARIEKDMDVLKAAADSAVISLE